MVKLTFYDKLNIEISSDDDYELDLIRSLLTTREKIRKFNYKTKKTQWVTEEVNQYRIKRNKVYVGAGYLPILEEFLIEEEIEYEVIGKPEVDKIKIKDNWIERFKNHPKGEEYSKAQLEFARVVEENNKGVLSLPVGCFSGDTKVRLLDGTTPTMKELAESNRRDFWVLSTDDEGKIIPSKATSCWKTKTTSDLVVVTLDDDTKYTCTTEHLWRMRNGSWKRADELVENDSLMPLYCMDYDNMVNKFPDKDMYFKCNGDGRNLIYEPKQKLIRSLFHVISEVTNKEVPENGYHIHHIDFNKMNDTPENLEKLTAREHLRKHGQRLSVLNQDSELQSRRGIKAWYDENGNKYEHMIEIARNTRLKYNLSEIGRKRSIVRAEYMRYLNKWKSENITGYSELQSKLLSNSAARTVLRGLSHKYGEDSPEYQNKLNELNLEKSNVRKALDELLSNLDLNAMGMMTSDEFTEYFLNLMGVDDCQGLEFSTLGLSHNHKVKSVERYAGEPIDVYDIEVPGLENFAIEDGNGSGVFVHNSGKGDMIVALVDSFLSDETKSGNVVLISYSAKVCEELKERLKQFSIESERVKVIQPTGYCRRTVYKTDEELFEWDSNVSLFIADECHHFTASSWKEYTERCQPDYIYGFSGSADKDGGWEINLDNIKQRKLETAAFDVMSYCGPAITHKELPTPIRIYRTTRWIADKETYKAFIDNPANPKQLAPKFTLMNPEFPKILKEVIEKCTSNDSICYIPELTSIESGVFLCKSLNELGIPTLFLSGQTIESPVGEVEMTLEDIKEMARGKYIKVLISNGVGVEGIDIPGLSSIVSLTGKSYKNVVQAIGRSARANVVDCIFIFDKNNGVYNSQAYSRYKTVTQRLNIVSNVVI